MINRLSTPVIRAEMTHIQVRFNQTSRYGLAGENALSSKRSLPSRLERNARNWRVDPFVCLLNSGRFTSTNQIYSLRASYTNFITSASAWGVLVLANAATFALRSTLPSCKKKLTTWVNAFENNGAVGTTSKIKLAVSLSKVESLSLRPAAFARSVRKLSLWSFLPATHCPKVSFKESTWNC